MKEWALESPWLTFFIVCAVLETIVQLVQVFKNDRNRNS